MSGGWGGVYGDMFVFRLETISFSRRLHCVMLFWRITSLVVVFFGDREVVLFCEVLLFRLEEILSVVVVFSEGRGVLFVEVLMFRLISFPRRFHCVMLFWRITFLVVLCFGDRGVLVFAGLMFRLKEVSFFRRFHGVCELLLFCTTTDNDK